MFARMRNKILK